MPHYYSLFRLSNTDILANSYKIINIFIQINTFILFYSFCGFPALSGCLFLSPEKPSSASRRPFYRKNILMQLSETQNAQLSVMPQLSIITSVYLAPNLS